MKSRATITTFALIVTLATFQTWANDNAPAAKLSPDARKIIDQISAAYGKLHSLNLSGTISVDLQVEGSSPEKHSASFTAAFIAPNRFRHEVKGDVLIGSTGQKLYTFQLEQNAYTQAEAPKGKAAADELPKSIANLLAMQDPSLLLAVSQNPGDQLLSGITEASTIDDGKLGDGSAPILRLLQKDKSTVTFECDPKTYLVHQMTADLTAQFKQRRPDLDHAIVTVAYTTIDADADAAKDELFAWSPPPGAKNADAMAAARPMDDTQASQLEGKDAPVFKLDALEGKPVSLADLKGKVVVLDFWATWCGPCRASLPHLNKLYDDMKSKGLVVYAVNLQEDKKEVQDFVTQTKLTVPVLLDTDGKAAGQYGAEAIPEMVLIGKDGKVKKVMIGFAGDESAAELQKAVDDAMK